MKQKIICYTNQIDYIEIRKAMIRGARTKEELQEMAGVCLTCAGCVEELDKILTSVCGCQQIALSEVVQVVNDGATTVDEVVEATNAGSMCGRCQALIANVIKLGR